MCLGDKFYLADLVGMDKCLSVSQNCYSKNIYVSNQWSKSMYVTKKIHVPNFWLLQIINFIVVFNLCNSFLFIIFSIKSEEISSSNHKNHLLKVHSIL